MKKLSILLLAVLLLCLCASAWAEDGVNIEVIKMDGVSVVVLTPESTMRRARSLMAPSEKKDADFALPESLTLIEEEAFAGIAAASVEVSDNVVAIEARAFADCKNLREITIPATVQKIDDHAFDGCEGVTVYGAKGTAAEKIANLCGFTFVDPSAQAETPTAQKIPSAPVLPPAPLN